ncbi:unnamed protein product, partial [Hymenolepis diminuta]
HKRDTTESEPSKTDSDDSSSTIIAPKTKFDKAQFHNYSRECSKELRLSLTIPTLNEERRNRTLPSKRLPPKRDGSG